MKSIKIKSESFTLDDLEEGLMLAGYITPCSVADLQKREALEEYPKSLPKKNPENVFFKRVTLAAEIAWQLHNEPTMGRIKFQKLVYLCEHAAKMELKNRYKKLAAGPFDAKFMHSIEHQFRKNKWFETEKVHSGDFVRTIYRPMECCDDYKKYYSSYFKSSLDEINYVIELFRKTKTDTTEIAATLHFCRLEINNEHTEMNEEDLLRRFYKWSKAKSRFSRQEVINTWNWMIEKGISPDVKQ